MARLLRGCQTGESRRCRPRKAMTVCRRAAQDPGALFSACRAHFSQAGSESSPPGPDEPPRCPPRSCASASGLIRSNQQNCACCPQQLCSKVQMSHIAVSLARRHGHGDTCIDDHFDHARAGSTQDHPGVGGPHAATRSGCSGAGTNSPPGKRLALRYRDEGPEGVVSRKRGQLHAGLSIQASRRRRCVRREVRFRQTLSSSPTTTHRRLEQRRGVRSCPAAEARAVAYL